MRFGAGDRRFVNKVSMPKPKRIMHSSPTRRHVKYCMQKLAQLQSAGIHCHMVFDGAALPAKAAKEAERLG